MASSPNDDSRMNDIKAAQRSYGEVLYYATRDDESFRCEMNDSSENDTDDDDSSSWNAKNEHHDDGSFCHNNANSYTTASTRKLLLRQASDGIETRKEVAGLIYGYDDCIPIEQAAIYRYGEYWYDDNAAIEQASDRIETRKEVAGLIYGYDDCNTIEHAVFCDIATVEQASTGTGNAKSVPSNNYLSHTTNNPTTTTDAQPGAFKAKGRSARHQTKGTLTPHIAELRRVAPYGNSEAPGTSIKDDNYDNDIGFMTDDEERPSPSIFVKPLSRSVVDVSSKKIGARRTEYHYWMFLFAILSLVAVGIACGVVLGRNNQNRSTTTTDNDEASSSSQSITELHSWRDIVHVCSNENEEAETDIVSMLSPEVRRIYKSYESSIKEVVAGADAASVDVSTRRSSCSPQTQALVSMAIHHHHHDGEDVDEQQGLLLLPRYALSSFFFGAKGENWASNKGWVEDDDICEWHGVGCSSSINKSNSSANNQDAVAVVEELQLNHNNLRGSLVDEIYLLKSLKTFSLVNQHFDGTLYSMIGDLTNLEELTYFGSGRSRLMKTTPSSLPTEMGRLTKLRRLLLNDYVKGPIPSEIGLMTSLEKIAILSMEASSIPEEITSLTNLRHLSFDGDISGSFPEGIWLLPSLHTIDISPFTYSLEGETEIPAAAFENNTSWTNIRLRNTFLKGSIPTTIGRLTELAYIDFTENNLDSIIPTEIGLCTNLVDLMLDQNSISGSIPSELSNLSSSLEIVSLRGNRLTGELPTELGGLSSLWQLNLDSNYLQLSDGIPVSFGNLTRLEILRLAGQSRVFGGTIPRDVCEIGTLSQFTVTCGCGEESCYTSCCTCG